MCIDQRYTEIRGWSAGSEKNQLPPCSREGWLNRNRRRQESVVGLLIENKVTEKSENIKIIWVRRRWMDASVDESKGIKYKMTKATTYID
jgi:hypothetical protein